jgi:NAD-dependent SIR2 family protein deacetylase
MPNPVPDTLPDTLAGSSAPPVGEAVSLLSRGSFVALTGAGMSTDSGIPDYRGPGAPVRMPMTYSEYVSGPNARQRYWARSHLGWSRMRSAEPNPGHRSLAALEAAGRLRLVITQNVDGLHEAAGSRSLCALHGRIAEVVCLGCRSRTGRAALHARLAELNPGWSDRHADVVVRPDGDVELSETDDFVVPDCDGCGGVLKPDVVFYGENVPLDQVAKAQRHLETADAMLIVGSSLMVYSGYRFALAAARRGIPIAAVNLGRTRADGLLALKIEERCETAFSFLL